MSDTNIVVHTANAFGVGVIAATLVGWLPALAAGAAFLLYIIQIKETKSFKDWLERWKIRRQNVRLLWMRAESRIIQADMKAAEKVAVAEVVAEQKVAKAETVAAEKVAAAKS